MTKVLATGVFNILHPGHLLFLEESKKLGDELIVIVSSDKIAGKIKKGLVLPEQQRADMVAALKPVDKVFVGDSEDTMKLLPVIKPDVIALGHDQKVDEDWLLGQTSLLKLDTQLIRIKGIKKGGFMSSSAILKALDKA
jgi:FAD synthetase